MSYFLLSYRSDRLFRALHRISCKRNQIYLLLLLILTNDSVLFQNDIYYTCSYVFSSRHRTFHFTEEDNRTVVIGKLYFAASMRLKFITHSGCRYSNTLLVTLNNRIYFRDRASPRGPNAVAGPSGHSSHHISQVRPPGIATTNRPITFNSFSSSTDLERDKTDDNFAVSNLRPLF